MAVSVRRAVVFAVCVLLGLAVCFYQAERRKQDATRTAAVKHLEQDAQLLSRLFVIADPARLDAEIDEASRGLPFRVTVMDRAGNVLADSAFSGTGLRRLENHGNRAEVIAAAGGKTGSRYRYSTSTGRWLLYAAAPLESRQGIIRLAIELPSEPWISPELLPAMLGLLGLLLVLAIVLLVPPASAFSKAKREVTAALTRLAAGSETTIHIPSSDLLGDVARATEAASRAISQQLAALESERKNLAAVLSSMPEAVMVTDRRGRIVKVNPAFRQLLRTVEEPEGRRPLEAVRNPEIQSGIDAALEQNQQREVEARIGERSVLARFSPIGLGPRPSGVVMIVHDITRLRSLESVRRDFLTNVSHELKTPLTSIAGYSETLLAEEGLTSTQKSFLEKIHRHAQSLSQLLDDLFKLARLESNSQALTRRNISMHALMADLEGDFSSWFSAKGIDLEFESFLPDDGILGSEEHLRRVFANLLENALKYTEKGRVRVEARRLGQDVMVSVCDTGIGIPAEDLGRIFERFYRVSKGRSREGGGAGVGLALVKHIVELHGGRVWAESEVGRGTKVSFTLPQ
ncbi:MAG: ATP-binding protein [Acidobacteriota bacterium]